MGKWITSEELMGKTFRSFTVVEVIDVPEVRGRKLICDCVCGKRIETILSALITGVTKCACQNRAEQKSHIGDKINMLTIKKVDENITRNVIVECECGGTKSVAFRQFLLGKVKSCGCLSKSKPTVGEKYNRFTIIEDLPSIKYGNSSYKQVKAVCECGNSRDLCYKDLKRGKVKSCGCLAKELKITVNEGDIYGFWKVIEESNGYFLNGEKVDRNFLCKCICGKEREVNLQALRKGSSKSCGCQGITKREKPERVLEIPIDSKEEQWLECFSHSKIYISTIGNIFNYIAQNYQNNKTSYGISINNVDTRIKTIEEMYRTFISDYSSETHKVIMTSAEINIKSLKLIPFDRKIADRLRCVYGGIKNRCNNPNSKDYKNYGGRGIKVEASFDNFNKFYEWMISKGYTYDCKLEIDRRDNDGNYSVDNCRLVSHQDNNRNMSRNVMTLELVDKIRYGEYKKLSSKEISLIIGCCADTVKSVRQFKTWVD